MFPVADFAASTDIKIDTPVPTGTGRILFVDDESELVELGKRMLATLEYQTETLTISIEALDERDE